MEAQDSTQAAARACLDHAESLILSAKAVSEARQHNVAYHLAVLALEELGKRQLILLNSVALGTGRITPFNEKQNTDHQKKLFWCFFGGLLATNKIDPAAFKEAQELAETIHAKRMAGLYVDVSKDGVSVPSDNITEGEASNLIRLAEARLAISRGETLRDEIPDHERELQRWFLSATDVPETRSFIFSKSSLAKLAEMDEVPAWARWVREELRKQSEAERQAVERELARQQPTGELKPKWRIRFRLATVTHSVRPGPLKLWNAAMPDIRLSPIERKPEILVDMTLHDNVPLTAVYSFGWALARHLAVCLNLATLGTWWWHFADDVTGWYERIDDLENNKVEVVIKSDEEPLDWGRERKPLTDSDITRLMSVFVALPVPPMGPREATFADHYANAIADLSASNVHKPRYAESIMRFLAALHMLMVQRGDIAPDGPLEPAFAKFVADREADFEEQDTVLEIIRVFDKAKKTGRSANGPHPRAKHAGIIKAFVSWYYMELIQPIAYAEIRDKFKKSEQ